MPFVIEKFDVEKYPLVDALLANFQGVFLKSVRRRLLGSVQVTANCRLFHNLSPFLFCHKFY